MAALEELDGCLDELQELFEAEDKKARSALQRLEEDGADLVQLDEMLSGWRDEVDAFEWRSTRVALDTIVTRLVRPTAQIIPATI